MEHVAQRAGVSVATVSHVINETRFVSDATRQKVLNAMRDLDYRPNRLARSLRLRRTRILGLVVPDNANPFFAEVLRGLENEGFGLGYNVILCNSDDDHDKELEYAKVLLERQVDGIVLIPVDKDSAAREMLASEGVPFVLVDCERVAQDADTVMADNRHGGLLATQHLLDLGHQRIACITGPSSKVPSVERVMGYQDALAEAGLVPDESLIVRGDFRNQGGYDAAQQLLVRSSFITAVFCCNDLMAIGAMQAVHEAGLRVPQDVSVVGFDDIPLSSYTRPRLTTIRQPTQQIGKLAAEMLVERINDVDAPMKHEVLPVSLVVRESSTPPGGES